MGDTTAHTGNAESSVSALDVTARHPVLGYDRHISKAGYTAVAVILTLTWLLGTLGNATSLVVFACHKRLRSPTNMFVMSLNASDLLMSCLACFFCLSSAWNGGWLYGTSGCTFEGFLVYMLGMVSMYCLAAISFDRYVVIAKPLLSSRITPRVAAASIALCWVGGFVWAFLPLVGWNHYQLEGAGISCSVVWETRSPVLSAYIWAIFVFCFLLPVGVMLFSYYHVFMTIRSISRNQVWDKSSRIARRNQRVEKKMARTIAAMLGAYLGCWMPYTVFSFVVFFTGSGIISPELATYPAIIAKSQGVLNPIIYVASNKQFRQALYQLLPCPRLRQSLVRREQDEPASQESEMGDDTAGPSRKSRGPEVSKRAKQAEDKEKAKDTGSAVEAGHREETVVEEICLVSSEAIGGITQGQGRLEDVEMEASGCAVVTGIDLATVTV